MLFKRNLREHLYVYIFPGFFITILIMGSTKNYKKGVGKRERSGRGIREQAIEEILYMYL